MKTGLRAAARAAGLTRYADGSGIERYTSNGASVAAVREHSKRYCRVLKPIKKPPLRKKQYTVVSHEQKRQIAKHLIADRTVKQVAAEFGISLDCCYRIAIEYTVLTRTERFPDNDESTAGAVSDS